MRDNLTPDKIVDSLLSVSDNWFIDESKSLVYVLKTDDFDSGFNFLRELKFITNKIKNVEFILAENSLTVRIITNGIINEKHFKIAEFIDEFNTYFFGKLQIKTE